MIDKEIEQHTEMAQEAIMEILTAFTEVLEGKGVKPLFVIGDIFVIGKMPNGGHYILTLNIKPQQVSGSDSSQITVGKPVPEPSHYSTD